MPTAVGALMGSPSAGSVVTAAMRSAKNTVSTEEWGVAEPKDVLRLSDPRVTQSYGARTRTSRRSAEGCCHKFGRHPRRCRHGNRRGARRATFPLLRVTERANRHASHRPNHDTPCDQRRRERAAGHLDAARPED